MGRLDYSAPGVYVEEVRRGARTIQGINMSVAGFVGFTEDIRGSAELFQPTLITSWGQYLQKFAKVGSDGFTEFGAYLPYAVKGWFENGGGRCWVVSLGTQLPIPPDDHDQTSQQAALAPKSVQTIGRAPSLDLRLTERAASQGRINVIIQSDTPLPSNDPDEEAFDTGEFFKVILERDGELLATSTVEEDGTVQVTEAIYRHLTMDVNVEPSVGTYIGDALQNCEFLELDITAEPGFALARRPANGLYEVKPPEVRYAVNRWYPRMYGNRDRRSGIQGLFEIDEVAMVACPDLMLVYEKGLVSLPQVHAVMEMMVTSCENSAPSPAYRMAVFDPPPVKPGKSLLPVAPNQQEPQDVYEWLMDFYRRRSQFAALYYPWLEVPNPRKAGEPIYVPPCGHMMGIWCRTDESRGIHKAPANENPRGILGLAYDTNFREQELLNPKGINCIRHFRDRGTLVWGARTLAQTDDIDWRYISVRRLMSYIEKSIEEGTQWAVFEPNDEDLWARVTRTVKNFLERIWREGALFGSTPDEAFFVRCDAELNTPETMKLGLLYVEVGVSPVRPAEFIIFRVSQWDPTQEQQTGPV